MRDGLFNTALFLTRLGHECEVSLARLKLGSELLSLSSEQSNIWGSRGLNLTRVIWQVIVYK